MKIKGAIFDMDGTLVDSLMFWDVLWKRIGKIYLKNPGFMPSIELEKAVRTMIISDAMPYIKKSCNVPVSDEEFLSFGEETLVEFYKTRAKIKDGVIELLDYLKSIGVKVCIASATNLPYVYISLKETGLSGYFDTVLSCNDIGVGKDRPDIYIKAKEALGFDESEICVFEDSFVALETAKSAGFLTVGVYDAYNFEQERLKAASVYYIGKEDKMSDLIPYITND